MEADVLDAVKRGEQVIRVLPGAIITPLARDTMKEKGVRVEEVGGAWNRGRGQGQPGDAGRP